MPPHNLNTLLTRIWTKKVWYNVGIYCNGKNHPDSYTGYRRYRRGKNRCSYCGYKLGKPKMFKTSFKERITDAIYHSCSILDLLRTKGVIHNAKDIRKRD